MLKIRMFFKFITNKEFLIKVILIQIVMLLFVIMTGNLTIGVGNANTWSGGFKIKGDIKSDIQGDINADLRGSILTQ
jgi:hypothetical protein